MKKIWPYITSFLAGALIVTLLLIRFLLKQGNTVINTDSYVDSLNQKIGKIKAKGKENTQGIEMQQEVVAPVTTNQEPAEPTKKELRKAKRAARKAAKKNPIHFEL